jgi:hypothetical protein
MAETLETLFAGRTPPPTFEQVFGLKGKRIPKVCCVTGSPIRQKQGQAWTRHGLGNGYSVFATRPLTDERKAALTALTAHAPKVKEPTNG